MPRPSAAPAAPPSVAIEHWNTTLKGLGRIVPADRLRAHLAALPPAPPAPARVPLAALRTLIEGLAAERNDPLLAVRAFATLDYRPDFLQRTFLSSALLLGEAMDLLARHDTLTDLADLLCQVEANVAWLRLTPHPDYRDSPLQLDALLYAMLHTLRGLGLQGPCSVELAHPLAAPSADDYAALFGSSPRFDAPSYALSFPASELARPLAVPHAQLERLGRRERRLLQHQPQPRWSEAVSALLAPLLRNGDGQIDRCAALLAVSRRTLQRRIEAEGTSFRLLVDEVRRALSLRYLAAGYRGESVAALIGYRQPGQFYRAFRAWHGDSPRAWQQQAANPAFHNNKDLPCDRYCPVPWRC